MSVAIEAYNGSLADMASAMGCCCSRQKAMKLYHATLTFKRAELVYDVRNYCYAEGHIMDENAEHSRHMTKDVGEEGNIDRVTRVLQMCWRIATERLYQWTKHELHVAQEPEPWDDVLTELEVYNIELILPENVSQTTVNLIEEMVHEYMVCSAVADWLRITKPDAAERWALRAQEAMQTMEGNLHTRMSGSVLTRPLQPF